MAILTGERWSLPVLLTCTSLTVKAVEHFVKANNDLFLLTSLVHFSWVVHFLNVCLFSLLYILANDHLPDESLAKTLSHLLGLMVSFTIQKLCSFMIAHLLAMGLFSCVPGVSFRKSLPVPTGRNAPRIFH